jgi:hypothetical protein
MNNLSNKTYLNTDQEQILELKTTVEIENNMKLIDINGKKISFKSDCIVLQKDNKKFKIAIVNQNDLDNGNINFEIFNNEFKRRVIYESLDGQHLNHYIVLKKIDNDTNDIKCDIIIRLSELKVNPENIEKKIINSEIDKKEIEKKLYELSQLKEYRGENEISDKIMYRNIGIFCIIIFILFILIRK